jgi:putative ABC transport system permease protein
LLLGLLTLSGGLFSSLVPSIKTAVAYPLANKFRTGMTIAMISLVMFSLVMFSTMNENFDRLFLSDDALAGYDILVTENPGNPIDNLDSALRNAPEEQIVEGDDGNGPTGDQVADAIVNDDRLAVANRQVSDVTQLNAEEPEAVGYEVFGASPDFLAHNGLTFQARATGFSTDEQVLAALASNPDYAIIDSFAMGGGFDSAVIEGLEPSDTTFAPIPVEVRDSATGQSRRVEIIGVMTTTASGLFFGLYVSEDVFEDVFERRETTLHYLTLAEESDSKETARAIERALLAQGVQADSLRKVVDDYQAQSRGFTYLLQGFMGIGLFVGIAAVGVIAFRTVVERRQQIGMLRAIGYKKNAIALSFLMESSFTALLGITSGIVLGLLLANQLVKTDDFVAGGVRDFYIPWVQILSIAGFAFIASLVMTIIPSRQAASIPIADALRYE